MPDQLPSKHLETLPPWCNFAGQRLSLFAIERNIRMHRSHTIGLSFALLVALGISSCSKQSGPDLSGTWNVKSAVGDTTAHAEPYIGYVVWAETFEQGGSMAFDTEDSVTVKMPPLMKLHRSYYAILPNNKIMFIGKSGHPDTANYKLIVDTLWINNPAHRTSVVLVRGAL